MSKIGIELPKEYSDRFDKLRQNRVEVSFYKYGTAADNFGMKLVDALESHDMCIKRYKETGNTEYLCDARKWKCRVRCYARCIRNHVIRNFHAHHEPPRLKVIYNL